MVDENGTVPFAARMKQPILAGLVVILAMTSVMDARNKMDRMNEFPGYVLAGKSLVKPALWMRDHLPDGATIATRRIGAVAYYSGLKIFDYTYGLPDPAVARLVARHGGRLDTPTEPALAELWRTRAPDYLLEDGLLMDQIILQAGGVRERFFIHGIEYHVIHQFSIGRDVQWVLAGRRLDPKNGSH
jgi:hypothetical protein